ncbi:MAG: membrane protein insertion efficiency factor YidD [Bacteroidales bacterium]|nr:membrane protein insertion efficiency factor YidD [Bacteroidales bacterium]
MFSLIGYLILIPVYIYKWFISPLTGPSCRHTPTCSQYAIDVIKNVGPVRGFLLATNRFFRCRPGGTHGHDPAPRIRIKRYKSMKTITGQWVRSNRLKH